MKSRQRKQQMHEARVKRKSAKAANKRQNTRAYGASKKSTKSHVPRQMGQEMPFYSTMSPFLQLLTKSWQAPQSDQKIIPFKPFQSDRKKARVSA